MNEKPAPVLTIQQKITQNGCGAGCGKGCLILIALILGFLAITTHSCTSNFRRLREKSTTTTSVTLDQPPPKTEAEVATTKEQLPNAATVKTTTTNNPPPKTAAEIFTATNEPARKLKQSVDKAKLAISANPEPVIQAATRAIVEEKRKFKSMIFKELEIRKHAEGRLLIQRFTLDGKPYRHGFLERTPGDFTDIDPSQLKTYISNSTPED